MAEFHSFNIEEARKYGIEKAVLLYNIRHWLKKNKANGMNIRDGYVWTYNSSVAFADLFPYMTERSIRRWLQELENSGVILSGNYNKNPYDKTKWYTIPLEFSIPGHSGQGSSEGSAGDDPEMTENGQSGQTENGQPIPDVTPNVTTDVTPTSGEVEERKPLPDDFEKQNKIQSDLDGRVAALREAVYRAGGMTYTDQMLDHFIEYWTEPDRSPKPKMKFEKQKHFEIKRRLKWWATNTSRRKMDGYPIYKIVESDDIKQKKAAFQEQLRPFVNRYGSDFMNYFYQIWSMAENIPEPKYLMWEKEEFWDLANRLAQYHTNWTKKQRQPQR